MGEFTIPGPSIHSQSFADLSQTGATLRAKIDPNGKDTTYLFQYVSAAQFDQSGYAEATEVPLGGEAIGAGNQDVEVAQPIAGLAPGAAYRFRVVASNELGVARGPDMSFATYVPPSSGLPDGRAYEQASPVDKNGANVEGGTNAVQASPDGNGITFFAAGGLPGGEGAQGFPVYLANRSSASWSTQSFSPPPAAPAAKPWAGARTCAGPSTATTSPANRGPSMHARARAGPRSKSRAGWPAPTEASRPSPPRPAATPQPSPSKTPPSSCRGQLRKSRTSTSGTAPANSLLLGGVLNSGLAPSEGAFAGPYDWFGVALGDGGSTSKYYTQAAHVLSADASHLFFTSAADKQLYVRVNPLAPQSPLDPGGNCTDPAGACTLQVSKSQATVPDPAGEQPAIFAEATPDGRYVLFMSAGRLTDDATAGRQLYRYDTETGELVDLTVETSGSERGAGVQGVLGTSADGSHAYFAANGVLAAGATGGNCGSGGNCNIYAWHDGATTLISRVSSVGDADGSDETNWLPTTAIPVTTEKASRVDPAGRVLLFRSKLPLTGYDNNGQDELYRAELTPTGRTLQCVSCLPTGAPANGDASLQAIPPKLASPKGQAPVLTHNLSRGGGRIFFDSPEQTGGERHQRRQRRL